MRKKRWLVGVILTALLAVGCLYPLSQARAEGEDEAKNVLRVGVFNEIEGLNPFTIYSSSAYEIMRLNYNLLVTVDQDVKPAPDLAKSWSSNDAGTVWTFNLQEGVKWQDGQPFTSDDVKFTLEYIRDNQLGYFYDSVVNMKDIAIPDEKTVVVTFSKPAAYMPQFVVPILPKHIWKDISAEEANSTFANDNPVGTGPFQVVEFKKGEFTRLKANPDYFKGAPKIDEIVFRIYANASTAAEALKLGEVDIISKMPSAQFKSLEGIENIQTVNGSSPGFTEMAINSWSDPASKGNPILKDVRVRQAMACAIDKKYLVDAVMFGYGQIGSTIVPPTYKFWHYEPSGEEAFAFDLEKSKKILEDAGYKDTDGDSIRETADGKKMSFRLTLRSEDPQQVQCGRIISEWFKQVGIATTIDVVESGTLTDRIYDNADYDMFIWTYYMDPDPSSILRIMTGGQIMSWNDSFYSNAKYDELFLQQEQQVNLDERKKMVDEMQKIIYNDCPYIVLFYGPELEAYRTDKFSGWTRTPADSVTIMTHNILTYENMTVGGEAQEAAAPEKKSMNWIIIVIALVVVIAAGVAFSRKKKKSEDDDD